MTNTEKLRKDIRKLLGHYYCEDSWYSCPLAEGGCANEHLRVCNCGLRQKVDKLFSLFQEYSDAVADARVKEELEKIKEIRNFGTDFDKSIKVRLHNEYTKSLEDQHQQKPTEQERYDFFRGVEYAMDYLHKLLTTPAPSDLACLKHSRILIGKKGCIDCDKEEK
jgi:hypothetical protein